MTIQEIEHALVKYVQHGSTFMWIKTRTEKTGCLPKADQKAGHTLFKESHVQVRTNFNYNNTAAGRATAANSGSSKSNPYDVLHSDTLGDDVFRTLKSNKNKVYVKFYMVSKDGAINAGHVKWIYDGAETTPEKLLEDHKITNSVYNKFTAEKEYYVVPPESILEVMPGKNLRNEAFSDDDILGDGDPFTWDGLETVAMPEPAGPEEKFAHTELGDTINLDDIEIDLEDDDIDDEFFS